MRPEGELHLQLEYKPFEDDDYDSGYREADAYATLAEDQSITDVKSAAGASPMCFTTSSHLLAPQQDFTRNCEYVDFDSGSPTQGMPHRITHKPSLLKVSI